MSDVPPRHLQNPGPERIKPEEHLPLESSSLNTHQHFLLHQPALVPWHPHPLLCWTRCRPEA